MSETSFSYNSLIFVLLCRIECSVIYAPMSRSSLVLNFLLKLFIFTVNAKRSSEDHNYNRMNTISVVILDIEGTTTPISFVAQTLFPYIRKELDSYLHVRSLITVLY